MTSSLRKQHGKREASAVPTPAPSWPMWLTTAQRRLLPHERHPHHPTWARRGPVCSSSSQNGPHTQPSGSPPLGPAPPPHWPVGKGRGRGWGKGKRTTQGLGGLRGAEGGGGLRRSGGPWGLKGGWSGETELPGALAKQ